MSLLYSLSSTPRSISQLSVSAFDEKAGELDGLKKRAVLHMRKVNSLKLRYMDWWSNKSRSFLTAIQTIQMVNRYMCPQQITCMTNFNRICELLQIYIRANKISSSNPSIQLIDDYQTFWNDYRELRAECETVIMHPVDTYIATITRLRDPHIKLKADSLREEIEFKLDDSYDFTGLHDARENLFVYRASVPDTNLIGFINYLPHVINLDRKLCYLITKLHVEKE